MANIKLFLPQQVFESELLKTMGEAFDLACVTLGGSGQRNLIREVVAGEIMKSVTGGERDPAKIARAAVRAVDLGDAQKAG